MIVQGECGALFYETGRESYPRLPLARPDGLPTHHLRVVAIWPALMREVPASTLIHLSGDEWRTQSSTSRSCCGSWSPGKPVLPSMHLDARDGLLRRAAS